MNRLNGAQYAAKSLRNAESIAARRFYDALWRWSQFGCGGPGSRVRTCEF